MSRITMGDIAWDAAQTARKENASLHEEVRILKEHIAKLESAQQNMHQTGLTPRQKEEVEQIIMRALSTGSV